MHAGDRARAILAELWRVRSSCVVTTDGGPHKGFAGYAVAPRAGAAWAYALGTGAMMALVGVALAVVAIACLRRRDVVVA
ncbi:MAG: hypothetical protein ACLPTJ_21805 [Solirubrobacteraceae bacterium]